VYSLRTKLVALSLVLVVLPGSVFGLVAFRDARRALYQAVGRQLATVANDAGHDLGGLLGEQRDKLHVWARQDVMREILIGDLDKRVARFLGSVQESNPGYVDLLCTDVDGRVVAASDPSLVGMPQAERAWFATARAGDDVLAGPMRLGATARRVLELATPVEDPEQPGTIIGVLRGRYDWGESTALLSAIRDEFAAVGLTVDVLVLDAGGTVISGSAGARLATLEGRNLRAEGWAAAEGLRGKGRHAFTSEPTAGVVVGYAPVAGARSDWSVLALQPERQALAPVYAMRRRLTLALGAVLVVGLALAIGLAERMIGPLRRLTEATRELARTGPPGGPVTVRRGDEIGELARSFNTMATALKRAQDDLAAAARLAFVGEVAAGIAHEVRTPLGILRGSAQILARLLAREAPSPARAPGGRNEGEETGKAPADDRPAELVQMIIEEVDRLDGVVTSLTELARPREPVREPTALGPLITRALDFVAAQAEAKAVTVRRELTAGACTAHCDPDQIYQVVLNIVVNALQMVPPGGAITARTQPAHGARVAFEISDNGPGIAPELRPHVFTPFVTSREGGTGLGLALVERVVRAHGGSVSVESEVGHGATFRVELPAADEEER
jgi:two-component system, NtrC family, sensor histidine kinase HydH